MNRDDEIRAGLRQAGVPDTVMRSTLVTEGLPELRSLIQDGTLRRSGIFVFCENSRKYPAARKAFFLIAKELFLTGTTVCCLSLSKLAEAIQSDDMVGYTSLIEEVRCVMILDFYEEGAPMPLDAAVANRVRSWIRSAIERGIPVSFLADARLEACGKWWPGSFLGIIESSSIVKEFAV